MDDEIFLSGHLDKLHHLQREKVHSGKIHFLLNIRALLDSALFLCCWF